MPIKTPTGWLITQVVICVNSPKTLAADPLLGLFDEYVQPDPRLLARPGADPNALFLPHPTPEGHRLRCVGGPRTLIDLDTMRRRGVNAAHRRYDAWRRQPNTTVLRDWEGHLIGRGRKAYGQYWGTRPVAVDAIVYRDRDEATCPRDPSLQGRLDYAQRASRLLDELPPDGWLLAATV